MTATSDAPTHQDFDCACNLIAPPIEPSEIVDSRLTSIQRLTAKEREVLELVHARLSSKEIGLKLGLSRKSVDQRLDNARAKLGASTRIAAARTYNELTGTRERFPYAPFPLPESVPAATDGLRVPTDATYTLSDSVTFPYELPWQGSSSSAPEFWALRLGALPRLVLILLGAVGLLVIALLGLSLSQGVTALFRG
jgi:DNA-binding CsgD family transcriptional regulator